MDIRISTRSVAPPSVFELWLAAPGETRRLSVYEGLLEAKVAAGLRGRPEYGSYFVREVSPCGKSLVRKHGVS